MYAERCKALAELEQKCVNADLPMPAFTMPEPLSTTSAWTSSSAIVINVFVCKGLKQKKIASERAC